MEDALIFSIVNVGVGFIVSWLLSMYFLPFIFNIKPCHKKATLITAVYTVAALVRNVVIYEVLV